MQTYREFSITNSFVNVPNVWRYVLGSVRRGHAAHATAPNQSIMIIETVFSINTTISSNGRPGAFTVHLALFLLARPLLLRAIAFLIKRPSCFEGKFEDLVEAEAFSFFPRP